LKRNNIVALIVNILLYSVVNSNPRFFWLYVVETGAACQGPCGLKGRQSQHTGAQALPRLPGALKVQKMIFISMRFIFAKMIKATFLGLKENGA